MANTGVFDLVVLAVHPPEETRYIDELHEARSKEDVALKSEQKHANELKEVALVNS